MARWKRDGLAITEEEKSYRKRKFLGVRRTTKSKLRNPSPSPHLQVCLREFSGISNATTDEKFFDSKILS
jgi:hypothetical protein